MNKKTNSEPSSSNGANAIVSGSASSNGHCRLKDDVWWYCEYGKLRGLALKGFSRRIKYKWKILNDENCKFNGQSISVVRDGKSNYCVVV